MAHNLLKAGHPVVVCDVVPKAVDAAVAAGATSVSTPKEVATQAKVIVTMLPASAHVIKVYTEENGIFSGAQDGTLLLDSSTIDGNVAKKVAGDAESRGLRMMDCPVSGGITAAKSGELTFMVGGSESDFADARQILDRMGKNIVHCGPSGSGQTAKVCNNLILGMSMIAVAEGMNLGVKLGMDPKKLAEIVNTSSGYCWSSQKYNPCPGVMPNIPASNNYEGGFLVDLMKKDLTLANDAANTSGVPTPLGQKALETYEMLSKEGFGKKDFAVIYQYLQSKSR